MNIKPDYDAVRWAKLREAAAIDRVISNNKFQDGWILTEFTYMDSIGRHIVENTTAVRLTTGSEIVWYLIGSRNVNADFKVTNILIKKMNASSAETIGV